MFRKIIILLVFCFYILIRFNSVFAQPVIISASGSLSHKGILTINGSGFGIKNTVSPLVWDDGESGLPGDKWIYRPSSDSGALGDYGKYGAYRTTQEINSWGAPYGGGAPQVHSRSTKYYCANAYTSGLEGGQTGQDEFSLGKTVNGAEYVYISFYYRVDPDWAFVGHGTDGNHKMMSVSSSNGPYSDSIMYWEIRCPRLNENLIWAGLRELFSTCAQTSCSQTTYGINPINAWIKYEYFLYFNSNGMAKATMDNVTTFEFKGCNPVNFNHNYVGLGGYHRNYGNLDANAANWRYADDIYFDTTFSRVMLTNNQTYENATIVEPQIPSAWSNNSITVMINLGKFNGGTAYLFVFDADNNHNALGYPVNLSGGVPAPPVLHP